MNNRLNGIHLAKEVESMKRNMPLYIESLVLDAELKRKYFLALKKNGFTDEQALEIVKGGN